MAPEEVIRSQGFTLVEILVGLAVAGMLAAVIASVMGQTLFSSRVLLEQERVDVQKTTFRKILHRDVKNMLWQSGIEPTSEGFNLLTGHNTLISSSLPVEVSWIFARGDIVRIEYNADLDYLKKQVLSTRIKFISLDMFCPVQGRWLGLDNWITGQDRPGPGALRLRLDPGDNSKIEIIEHLPDHG